MELIANPTAAATAEEADSIPELPPISEAALIPEVELAGISDIS